jgi:hypothetical protein
MNAICPHCETVHVQVDRNEDGSPIIETTRCAHPDCEVELCEAVCQDLSFCCHGCGKRLCIEHQIEILGLPCCPGCAIEYKHWAA